MFFMKHQLRGSPHKSSLYSQHFKISPPPPPYSMFKSKPTQKKQKLQEPESMEEIISVILHGCMLARKLKETLPILATQPDLLSNSLEEITNIFGSAKERVLYSQGSSSTSYLHNLLTIDHQQIGTSVEQWLRSNTQAMDIIQTQLAADRNEAKVSGGVDVRVSEAAVGGFQAADVSASNVNIASSSTQRPRRRKDQGVINTITVPAPRIGNTEIPPEDGFTWRKYGQKEIMNSRFPRGYYRCTHQKLYNCPAKKQVQRLDNDPLTFEVMYRGEHTCHMSATAPSTLPPPTADHHIPQDHMSATTEPPTSLWLSMDFNPIRQGCSSSGMIGGGRGSGRGSGDDVGTSAGTRYGKEVDFPVMDLADTMFNSASSSSSMDFIFNSAEHRWESDDKKNRDH